MNKIDNIKFLVAIENLIDINNVIIAVKNIIVLT